MHRTSENRPRSPSAVLSPNASATDLFAATLVMRWERNRNMRVWVVGSDDILELVEVVVSKLLLYFVLDKSWLEH